MKLTVVGASGSISGPDSPASCYLVQAPYQDRTYSLLLDLGPGSLGVLHRFLDPSRVEAILLSHLHPDHCLDLCGFYVAGNYAPTAPWAPPEVYGPSDSAARLARAYAANDADLEHGGPGRWFRFHRWAPEQRVGPFTVRTVRVDHPVEAYAVRLETAEASLVFSGDTGPCPALVELARGADLLLCEAAFEDGADNPPGVHLTGGQAGEHAKKAGVGRLVLTHVPPWFAPDRVQTAARRSYDGPVELARTGSVWRLGLT